MNLFVVRQMTAINALSKQKISVDNVDSIVEQYEETVATNEEISAVLTERPPQHEYEIIFHTRLVMSRSWAVSKKGSVR